MRGHRDPGGRERPHAMSEPHTYDPRREGKRADGWQLWLRPGSTPCWLAVLNRLVSLSLSLLSSQVGRIAGPTSRGSCGNQMCVHMCTWSRA